MAGAHDAPVLDAAEQPVSPTGSETGDGPTETNEQKIERLLADMQTMRLEITKLKAEAIRTETFTIGSPPRTRDHDHDDDGPRDELRPMHGRDIRAPENKYGGDKKDFQS